MLLIISHNTLFVKSFQSIDGNTVDFTKIYDMVGKLYSANHGSPNTDPECGVFHKGEHKKCFAYAAQTACDKNGYVLDVTNSQYG